MCFSIHLFGCAHPISHIRVHILAANCIKIVYWEEILNGDYAVISRCCHVYIRLEIWCSSAQNNNKNTQRYEAPWVNEHETTTKSIEWVIAMPTFFSEKQCNQCRRMCRLDGNDLYGCDAASISKTHLLFIQYKEATLILIYRNGILYNWVNVKMLAYVAFFVVG